MLHHHHSSTCRHHDTAAAGKLAAELLDRARSAGLRRTKALENILSILVEAHQPLSLADIAESPDLTSGADKATVYRVLIKLEELGFIRRLGLHDRSTYYTLIHAGHHDDYLICTQCGRIQSLDISCPVEALEKQIETTTGFRKLYHELEFYGLCPKCA
ncbi:MAG: transcriptional repressor [Prosthecobacter sp.]|jgi:Fur family ferric uptake transcriptional regulator|uniref:Fur family transcriptional regulator n=1 Tax=Prosthecobacter sp. TaxID=1965333 RepID=UPI001A09F153|nr:Fur family transcriptional regulator [Prosthecobacter sp.]MBE2284359.1 transcriptional repressor [Prosthecobacter sp.]